MFFQTDDKLTTKPKFDALVELGATRAAEALGVWTAAGTRCRLSGYDGVIGEAQLVRMFGDRRMVRRAASSLVEVGFWHAAGHECPKGCAQPPEGSWVFHEWFQFGYGTGEAEKTAVAKRKELRDRDVVESVWARDRDAAGLYRCRYCGREVERPKHGGNRKSAVVGQLDHVDPTIADGARNLVVACPDCNKRKAARTPEQAGMTLLPAPRARREDAREIGAEIGVCSATKSSEDLGEPGGAVAADQAERAESLTLQAHGSSSDARPHAGARAGAGVAGVGAGVEVGVGEGSGGVRRGRAGEGEPVGEVARFGSPWRDHHGPPPDQDLIDQATCAEHGLPEPCRKCGDATYREGER